MLCFAMLFVHPSIHPSIHCQKEIQRALLGMNILLNEKQDVHEQGDVKPKVVRSSETRHHRMAYRVKMRSEPLR